jgi:hypothetical protein
MVVKERQARVVLEVVRVEAAEKRARVGVGRRRREVRSLEAMVGVA